MKIQKIWHRNFAGPCVVALVLSLTGGACAWADTLQDQVYSLQSRWAEINYEVPPKQQASAFAELGDRAHALTEQYPAKAGPVLWEGIILSSQAGSMRGLDILKAGGVAKQARASLLEAERIDPTTMHGSVYTSLGALYDEAPGWPLSFGDREKAGVYLQKALKLNPDGIDPNYFWGNHLRKQGDLEGARAAYRKALEAPPRPDRPRADQGRRAEILTALEQLS